MVDRWSGFVPGANDLALATDLYQLTMAAALHGRERRALAGRATAGGATAGGADGPEERGSFELTVRSLPERRSFLVFAGLEPALVALRELRFSEESLAYLRGLEVFSGVEESFFDRMRDFRFRGDVWAMEEGTVFFPGEPVLRVTGGLIEAQVVETLLLSIVNFQTAIASKAARLRLAAGQDISLSEFGTRRAHGPQAGMWAARAAYLGGCDSTSNVLAGLRFGIPVVGTMAHSFVMAAPTERRAFSDYQATFPDASIFLVDTYDSLAGVEAALDLGVPFKGVRLDSGDLLDLSRRARRRLDAAGRHEALIFASGDVDETVIERLRNAGAPIDAYGVGSKLSTASDAPYLGGVYKLVGVGPEGAERPTFKQSAGKTTYPGRKQVWRNLDRRGVLAEDLIAPDSSRGPAGARPLLQRVMAAGEPLVETTLEGARQCARRELEALPPSLRALAPPAEPYPVRVSEEIERLLASVREARRRGP
jgi:nicotinate phosphoribosyltransferase